MCWQKLLRIANSNNDLTVVVDSYCWTIGFSQSWIVLQLTYFSIHDKRVCLVKALVFCQLSTV